MKDKNINILDSLKNVALLVSPKTKAIIYSVATLVLYCLILTSSIVALLSGLGVINDPKTGHIVIGVLTIFKGTCLTVQQAFNGKNIKQLKKIKNESSTISK